MPFLDANMLFQVWFELDVDKQRRLIGEYSGRHGEG